MAQVDHAADCQLNFFACRYEPVPGEVVIFISDPQRSRRPAVVIAHPTPAPWRELDAQMIDPRVPAGRGLDLDSDFVGLLGEFTHITPAEESALTNGQWAAIEHIRKGLS